MTTKRIVVCLDMKGGRVVKGVSFEGLRDVGDPVALARRYEAEGADELVFLDVSASAEERAPLWDVARRTAEQVFIPLTLGGGLSSVEDVTRALRAGADKVSLNSAVVKDVGLVTACARAVGSQCVVVSIDAKREGDGWRVFTHGGKRPTTLEAVAWARQVVAAGAGELLVTSIDRDGQRTGYDLELTRAIAQAVDVPVIASGGAGSARHLAEAFTEGGAEAALLAGILHDGSTTVGALKAELAGQGLDVREVRA
ncbi:MAG: imidazole glycerol phosphate synthase subunit HisF [Myxococcaceae bacterium]|nr:imidazole glycerol phosphate synthase subunit HisF [Myxococcaceae bacterium]MCA3011673.1 imidazole glycerol phosphate synthase subunit HisF [Myxococcaceae bacterium]